MNQKSWVFKKLVNDDKDFVGLVAYGFYKFDKSVYAEQLEGQGKPQREIDKALNQMHTQIVSTPSMLDSYRDKATQFIQVLTDAQFNALIADHENYKPGETDRRDKACDDYLKTTITSLAGQPKKSWLAKIGTFLAGSVIDVFRAIIGSFIILAILLVFYTKPVDKLKAVDDAAADIKKTLNIEQTDTKDGQPTTTVTGK